MRLMIADDDHWIRDALRAALEGPQIEILGEAPDGATALLMVAERRPDVLITDIRMPYLDGVRLTSYLTKAFDELVILGFTGDDRYEALVSAGARKVFLKPDMEGLVDEVESLVQQGAELRGSVG